MTRSASFVMVLRAALSQCHSKRSARCFVGKPCTTATIAHGRDDLRAVRFAPPTSSPLCCRSRRGGFTVKPMYVFMRGRGTDVERERRR